MTRLREIRCQARSPSSSARSGSGPSRSCIARFSGVGDQGAGGGAAQIGVVGVVEQAQPDGVGGRRRRGPSPKPSLPKRPRWMWIQPVPRSRGRGACRGRRRRCRSWPSSSAALSENLPWGLLTRDRTRPRTVRGGPRRGGGSYAPRARRVLLGTRLCRRARGPGGNGRAGAGGRERGRSALLRVVGRDRRGARRWSRRPRACRCGGCGAPRPSTGWRGRSRRTSWPPPRVCIRPPMDTTLASLCSRPSAAVCSLQASAARTPLTLFAAICSPLPEPPMTMPRLSGSAAVRSAARRQNGG